MPQFSWDKPIISTEDADDGMEGYDTGTESPPEVRQAKAVAVKEAVQDIMETSPLPEDTELSDVEYRLEKAQFYKMLLNYRLIDSDSNAAGEVEGEIQDFVRERLRILMGLAPAKEPQIGLGEISDLAAQLQRFSDEEVEVLKAVAARVLKKPELAGQPQPKSPPTIKPALAPPPKAQPKIRSLPEQQAPRGRGRPRKTPCEKCGQMVCVCAKGKPVPTEAVEAVKKETKNGEIQTLPDGTRIVEAHGRRYKLVKKNVLYRDGSVKEEEVPVDITPPAAKPKTAKPYPSEAEVAMMAQQEVAQNLSHAPAVLGTAIAASIKQGE